MTGSGSASDISADVWAGLAAALDACAADGISADFWWRDDDAIEATPALDRLLTLRRTLDVPLALAVIPARAQPSLADVVKDEDGLDLLQHGYAHRNHRPDGEKKAELGLDRELWDIVREIADGRGRMAELFGDDGWLEVMVPPWNRIAPEVAAVLPGLGFHGLTTFRARNRDDNLENSAANLRVVDTHIDIVDWKGSCGFAGDAATVSAAIDRLDAKRRGDADPEEATGLLTHHLAHDEACWDFVARFVAATRDHPAVRWRAAHDLFPAPEWPPE